ncbi:Glycosyltransferase involved in cell wall bisynthesis [Chitinophaga sp. YR627]|uniref:glycosyltransferase n=1 Tax=Chitinophaga sp. YR627 TaxID=1881041 RepID=UPI0008E3F596|nr:glycosyltransferase [Chitinophaga sp. YR627]SFN91923.1 Glycosyltransferase involved in cell wall bisynthesis [Chitinophaga sp. YR627]
MGKLLYISFVDYGNKLELGVIKKIEGQIKAFQAKGMEVVQLRLLNGTVFIGEHPLLKINGKMDFFIKLPLLLFRFFQKSNDIYNLVYLRKTYITPLHFFWIKLLHKKSKALLLEIPTYPYEGEMTGNKPALLLDTMANKLIKPYLTGMITSQYFDEIWGMKTIKIRNGYDFSGVKAYPRQRPADTLRFIAVTNLLFFHGLDRFIQAMHQYRTTYGEKALKIEFHIVGQGEEKENLVALIDQLGVEGVIFHGPRTGAELEARYMNADIGVGSLALYRKNVAYTSTLKTIEYCYYGLPFIAGACDRELSKDPFVMEVGNNDSPIDLYKVIEWYAGLTISQQDIQARGKALYSWDDQVEKIIDAAGAGV